MTLNLNTINPNIKNKSCLRERLYFQDNKCKNLCEKIAMTERSLGKCTIFKMVPNSFNYWQLFYFVHIIFMSSIHTLVNEYKSSGFKTSLSVLGQHIIIV